MTNYENANAREGMAPWVNSSAFNDHFTYSYINRSSFYSMIAPEYHSFMNRFVKNWLWWYDGWVPYFHNSERGIPSTRIGTALVNRVAKKVVGGRVMFKNAGKELDSQDPNRTLSAVCAWSDSVGFERVVKDAVKYAAAAGTSAVKLNVDERGLWAEALRFDSFLPVVGARGEVREIKCFLRCFTNLGVSEPREGEAYTSYYVVEWRHFADYRCADGRIIRNAPVVEYAVKTQTGSVTNGEFLSQNMRERIPFAELPKSMRQTIGRAYAGILFDRPILLPFHDHLGVEIMTWTEGVSCLPELPFGESFLSNILADLMSYDYYHAAANTDMYLGRGRVMVPKYMTAKNTGEYNSGIERMLYIKYDTNDPDSKTPTFLQPELRAGEWTEIRNRLIQDISINTGLNISTIASFLSDSTAARTAREVSTEENETAEFVNDRRAIVEKPLNRILKIVARYLGYTDDVVIRWSSAGLTNRYTLAEILQIGLSAGFISRRKAVEMFNYDDDIHQVEEEIGRIEEETKESDMSAFDSFPGMEGFNEESDKPDEQGGFDPAGGTGENPPRGEGVPPLANDN